MSDVSSMPPLQFVGEIESALLCTKCLRVPLRPVGSPSSPESISCHECWLDIDPTMIPLPAAAARIALLEIKCANDGCKQIQPFGLYGSDYWAHSRTCDHAVVKCKDCGDKVKADAYAAHRRGRYCSPCRMHLPTLAEFHAHTQTGHHVLKVTQDAIAAIQARAAVAPASPIPMPHLIPSLEKKTVELERHIAHMQSAMDVQQEELRRIAKSISVVRKPSARSITKRRKAKAKKKQSSTTTTAPDTPVATSAAVVS